MALALGSLLGWVGVCEGKVEEALRGGVVDGEGHEGWCGGVLDGFGGE